MVILFVILFFYGHTDPVYRTFVVDDPEQCVALAPKAKAAAESRTDVRVAQVGCVVATGEGDKT